MIPRSRLHLVIALLLPLLALKALLPPGYMPSAGDGELRIVMCSAGLAALNEGNPDAPDSPPAEHAACAFAMAGVAAPPPALAIALLPIRHFVAAVAARSFPAVPGALRRAQSPRAPPVFSVPI